jgi:hypothetical protein
MSLGLGRLQRALFHTILQRRRPLTFAEIRAIARKAPKCWIDPKCCMDLTFERSMRRSLQIMIRNGALIAIGAGGPTDPYRYFIHPSVLGARGDKELLQVLLSYAESNPTVTWKGTDPREGL